MIFSILILSLLSSYKEIKKEILDIVSNKEKTQYERMAELINKSETILNDNIAQKNNYVDFYGLVQKIFQKEYVEDNNDKTRNVVKTKDDMLTFIQKKEDMEIRAGNIISFQKQLEEEKINFMYIQAPYKVREEKDLPIGVIDYANENANVLVDKLQNANIDTVDLRNYFKDMDIKEEYFITDHHWKIQTGFKAANYISEILNKKYNFQIDYFFTDINNYKKIRQEKGYLGSVGKRVGKYYAELDDFEYIVPNFETELLVTKSEEKKEGNFEETIIVKELLDENDIRKNKYACYFGGDYPEIIIKNTKSLEDKKILVIQDSYGLTFSSFMSLRTKELRTIDLRHFKGSEIEYIKQYHPDIVIMMYNPSSFYIEKNFEFK